MTAMKATFEPIVGRYCHLTLSGRPHRLYVEEAGSGIPLVCLHTAGADGRQFRHILNDAAITRDYRVIVFDMPWHGKSLPPVGFETEEYQLTTDGYTQMVLDVCDALALDRPVVMGCSIGGRLVLNLAAEHPERFRALIGLESADHQQPWYDTEWLNRPDVHGGEICAALVSGMMAPQGPAESRYETLWMYKCGGPGIFKGDLYFYRVDGDLREKIDRIDTGRCPLYLLTGEYDFSCTPEDTQRTAARIKGAEAAIMKELGHFPMSENPAQFRRYILPVLEKIRAAGWRSSICGVHMARRIVDLSVALEADIASDPPGNEPQITYIAHKDPAALARMLPHFPGLTADDLPGGEAWAVEQLTVSTHNGTHLDAPYHFHSTMDGGKRAWTIDEVPLEWCMGRGVKLDFRHLPDGYVATPADVEAELTRTGVTLEPFDIVLVNTAAGARYGAPDYVSRGCGMGRAATLWLTERGVKIAGTDAWSWDAPFVHTAKKYAATRDASLIWEGHRAGMERAYCHIEKLANLEQLPATGYTVCCFPFKIKRASAGFTRVVAIFEDERRT